VRLIPRPLTAGAFAQFGTVASAPLSASTVTIGPFTNLRPAALPRLGWVVAAATELPVQVPVMERHRFSSQSFVPCDPDARWLLVVAPHAPDGLPDMARARAFIAGGDQAMTYAPDVWHRPLCTLGRSARFATLIYRDDGKLDEEFAPVTEAVTVAAV
jgi:ureidoglycolate lyase